MCIMIRILYMSYLAMNRYRDSIISSVSIKSALVATINSASIESASASVVRRHAKFPNYCACANGYHVTKMPEIQSAIYEIQKS